MDPGTFTHRVFGVQIAGCPFDDENIFYECSFSNGDATRIKKIYWNDHYEIMLVSTDDGMVAPVRPLNFLTKLWNWLLGLLRVKQQQLAPTSVTDLRLMINRTKNFDYVFYRQDNRNIEITGSPTYVESIVESYNDTQNYTAVIYRNIDQGGICDILGSRDITNSMTSNIAIEVGAWTWLDEIFNCSLQTVGSVGGIDTYDYQIFTTKFVNYNPASDPGNNVGWIKICQL